MSTPVLRSMTGFGVGEERLAGGTVRVELRAVNHRHLDIRVRMAPELSDFASCVEEGIRAGALRGRVEGQVRWEAPSAGGVSLDVPRVRAVYKQLSTLRDELCPQELLPLTSVLTLPGMLTSGVRLDSEEVEAALRRVAAAAVRDLMEMRAREGAVLAADLRGRLQLLGDIASHLGAQRSAMLDSARARLMKRVEKMLDGTGVELDPARLTQEVAWFAERSDIAEELTRLASHLQEFARSLNGATEGVGKKLDFLVQELGREVNTIGSKANDAGISHQVVEMKAELERIREQVQNLL
jgi:uncharacterized protein (TIGR00255 family)